MEFRAAYLLSAWPWATSLFAATIVDVLIGAARHFNFHGIWGFSTVNYGWLAFALVGGMVFAWRSAKRRLTPAATVRPFVAAAASFMLCFVAVTVTGLVFLPGQSLGETITTDAPGRSFPVAVIVLAFGYIAELLRAGRRSLSGRR